MIILANWKLAGSSIDYAKAISFSTLRRNWYSSTLNNPIFFSRQNVLWTWRRWSTIFHSWRLGSRVWIGDKHDQRHPISITSTNKFCFEVVLRCAIVQQCIPSSRNDASIHDNSIYARLPIIDDFELGKQRIRLPRDHRIACWLGDDQIFMRIRQ